MQQRREEKQKYKTIWLQAKCIKTHGAAHGQRGIHGQLEDWTDMDRISLAFLLCLAMGKPSWGLLLLVLLLLLLHLKRAKLLQKHVTLSAQTAATGSLWDLSAFIAAGILRAFALKLTLACGFPLCLCFFIPLPSF